MNSARKGMITYPKVEPIDQVFSQTQLLENLSGSMKVPMPTPAMMHSSDPKIINTVKSF